MDRFENRKQAGELLAEALRAYMNTPNLIILALPRGGVPVAYEVSKSLRAPLDAFVVRKLGVPGHEELAMGAISDTGRPVLNPDVVSDLRISEEAIDAVATKELAEVKRRESLYRKGRPPLNLKNKTVILVDDGLATGASMLAALQVIRSQNPKKLVAAVPVAPVSISMTLQNAADEIVCLLKPKRFGGVGQWYIDFGQTTDTEVMELLSLANRESSSQSSLNIELRKVSHKLTSFSDLEPLIEKIDGKVDVLIGEASHGTNEYYKWRCELSKQLILRQGFSFIAVEGDWPDCYKVNQFVKGADEHGRNATEVLNSFKRWPTWMWANQEVAEFLDWLRDYNQKLPDDKKVGYYGLDVYSLWESLRFLEIHLKEHYPDSLDALRNVIACYEPYAENEQMYARAHMFYSKTCEHEVVQLLQKILASRTTSSLADIPTKEAAFLAEQNALVLKNADEYYRTMVQGGSLSWNIRDQHMAETFERLRVHHGADVKALVWAHNTHVGDARYTDMIYHGEYNLGELIRKKYGEENVEIVGFAGYQGKVVASDEWYGAQKALAVPKARSNSWEGLLHDVFGNNRLLLFGGSMSGQLVRQSLGQRAIGVVYHPEREQFGNYVPTILSKRYDSLLFFDDTHALHPLSEAPDFEREEVPETYPSSM